MRLPCWKLTDATFVGVVFVGRLNFCALNGLPVAVPLPAALAFSAVVAVPTPVGLAAPAASPICAGFLTSVGPPLAFALPAPAALPTSVGFAVALALPAPAALLTSVGLPVAFALATPVDLRNSVGLPVAIGFPVAVGFPAVVGLPAVAGLPTAFLGGCETCLAWVAFFFCPGLFGWFCSCAPATHASARLQIKTRNILIPFFFLGCWTRPCPFLFNVGARSLGCLMHHCQHFCEAPSCLLSHRLEQHDCNCGRKVQTTCAIHWDSDAIVDVTRE